MGAVMNKALAERGVPESARMYLLHCVSRIFFYWLPNAVLYMATKKGWGQRWKIQGSRAPNREMAMKALIHNLATDLLPQLAINALFHKFLTLGKKSLQSKALTDKTTEEPKEADSTDAKGDAQLSDSTALKSSGWAGFRFTGPRPSFLTHAWQVAVGFLGYDAMFYWSHRLLHHKKLYKHCHKIHHQFHTSIGINSSHAHAVEDLIQLFNWYVPIGFAGFLNRHAGGLHVSTLFYYNCFRWIETVDAHSGYEFPFSPFKLLWPFFGGARMHDYHHRAFDGNYGASFFWDRLCGTDVDFWKEVFEEGGFLVGGKRVPLA